MEDSIKSKEAMQVFTEMYGEERAEKLMTSTAPLGPKLSRYSLEWVFGDLFAESTLSTQLRELVTIAGLVVSGDALPQLKHHVGLALEVGCKKEQIHDVILQMLLIKGFPSVVNAILAVQEVINEKPEV